MDRLGTKLLAVLAGLGLAAVSGCGGEKRFTTEEFVDAINAEGAAVVLGPVISTNEDGVEIRSVTLSETEPSPTGAEGEVHGSGAVLVLDDAGEAREELARCETAPSLVCFRAANAILRFEDLFPEDQARITTALQSIATE